MTTTLIYSVIDELELYKKDKGTLMPLYIEARLNKCLDVYRREISNSLKYLSMKESRKALKEELNEC